MHMLRRRSRPTLALVACVALAPLVARADEPAAFSASAATDLGRLSSLVAARSADLRGERLGVDLARADARQARRLGNPTLDAAWATVPLGETNPSGLETPLSNIPSYSVGLSYTFPLGKRGPRAERADALVEQASRGYAASARARAIELVRILGDLAVATLRLDGLGDLVAGGKGSVALAESRLAGGFATPLEVDRLKIELSRFELQILENEGNAKAALAACATIVGATCRPFESTGAARAWLAAWIDRASRATGAPEDRDDVRALVAGERAAGAEADLARAQKIPDPTIRLGYVYDQFVVSGNQRHSANVSIALPLPLFDHGQAGLDAAEARGRGLGEQRALALASARARVASLRDLLARQRERWATIDAQMLPPARAVVSDVEHAAAARLVPATDLIQARRTLDELLVQEAESFAAGLDAALALLATIPESSDSSTPKAGQR